MHGLELPKRQSSSIADVQVSDAINGNWVGIYGLDGYLIPGQPLFQRNPGYLMISCSADVYVWHDTTSNPRALRKPTTGRIASCWRTAASSGSTFDIDVTIEDIYAHRISLYCCDWATNGKLIQKISVIDADTDEELFDSGELTNFQDGKWLRWTIRGHVKIRCTNLSPNEFAVVNGIFFG